MKFGPFPQPDSGFIQKLKVNAACPLGASPATLAPATRMSLPPDSAVPPKWSALPASPPSITSGVTSLS